MKLPLSASNPWPPTSAAKWDRARAEGRPAPHWHSFIRKVADYGYRLPTLVAAQKYLEKCLAEKIVPGVQQLLGILLPWAVIYGLVVPAADPAPMPHPEAA